MIERALDREADAIARADAIFVGAGAGMGVDSGLPDFRGNQGFWRAYPPYERLGLDFVSLANHAGLPRIRRWPGDSTGTGWSFTGGPSRTRDSRSCYAGPKGSRRGVRFHFQCRRAFPAVWFFA